MKQPFLSVVGLSIGIALAVLFYQGFSTMPSSSHPPEPTIAASDEPSKASQTKGSTDEKQLAKATFGTGCFWCTESFFQQLKGVSKVTSGYIGGKVKNPTYRQVCEGDTGHAEAVEVVYDPKVISYVELLEVFWKIHDPTTLNRQGHDIGTQYRSAIFYHDEAQKKLATEYKEKLNKAGAFRQPIVTEITAASIFYPAENYHQNYFNLNGDAPYCSNVIKPKLDKFKEVFKDKLKKE